MRRFKPGDQPVLPETQSEVGISPAACECSVERVCMCVWVVLYLYGDSLWFTELTSVLHYSGLSVQFTQSLDAAIQIFFERGCRWLWNDAIHCNSVIPVHDNKGFFLYLVLVLFFLLKEFEQTGQTGYFIIAANWGILKGCAIIRWVWRKQNWSRCLLCWKRRPHCRGLWMNSDASVQISDALKNSAVAEWAPQNCQRLSKVVLRWPQRLPLLISTGDVCMYVHHIFLFFFLPRNTAVLTTIKLLALEESSCFTSFFCSTQSKYLLTHAVQEIKPRWCHNKAKFRFMSTPGRFCFVLRESPC